MWSKLHTHFILIKKINLKKKLTNFKSYLVEIVDGIPYTVRGCVPTNVCVSNVLVPNSTIRITTKCCNNLDLCISLFDTSTSRLNKSNSKLTLLLLILLIIFSK